MSKIKTLLAALLLVPASSFAGGLLTNTNQSVSFLRNPARDAAFGIDGVYSNPAGVVFLGQGFHLGLNIQSAYQNRDVTTTWKGLAFGRYNNGAEIKKYEGKAIAPIIPSVDAAYNMDNWSFQFHFALGGGGGKCEFDNGLGMFEQIPSLVSLAAKAKGTDLPYDADMFMRGRQYYYGFSLGAAYKVNENLSVYGGLRLVYANCNYYGYIKNIQFQSPLDNQFASLGNIVNNMRAKASEAMDGYNQCMAAAGQLDAAGDAANAAAYRTKANGLKATADQLNGGADAFAPYSGMMDNGVSLNCDQDGWGVTPIIGVDYKVGKFNFAAKYEFRTRMELKNRSTIDEKDPTGEIKGKLDQFRDGGIDRGDIPGLLTVGAQYEPFDYLRFNVGYHWYNDKAAKSYGNRNKKLSKDSHEILLGAEWDINKWLQFSAGWQRTMYGLTDDYLSDMSFITSSNTFGLGFGVQVAKCCKINVAYFQTIYDGYDNDVDVSKAPMMYSNNYERTNRVFGIGAEFKF